MPIATTNVDDLKKHQEQERMLKEKVNNVEHIDLKKVITIEDVLMKQRKENLENVVVESDLEQNTEKPTLVNPEVVFQDKKYNELKQELSIVKATATKLRTYVDKELKKLKGEIKELKKKE
jgi:hypothetical protein